MVEFEEDTVNQICLCKSKKNVKPIVIRKSLDSSAFFEIVMEGRGLPKQLKGRYSSINAAKKAVEEYIRKKPVQTSVRRKEFRDNYEKRKANASEYIPEGS